MEIRLAKAEDAGAIQRIYAPYVEQTAITFEYDVPDPSEMERRIMHTLQDFPYLVAVEKDQITGYAYAGRFRPRAAYQHSAEVSIYLDAAQHRKGIGTLLYRELEAWLLRQHVLVSYACITTTERETDPYLTDASIRFHSHLGYSLAGSFSQCGYKFGQWYSMIWMEKNLAARPSEPEPFIPFRDFL